MVFLFRKLIVNFFNLFTMSIKIKSLIIASIACTGLYAQTDSTTKVLDEVVITATKTEQKQSTTGKVVTVISKTEIEQSQGKTLGQLLNDQAGVVVNGALNTPGSVQRVYTRGAGNGRTLVLIDGIPAIDPSDPNNSYDINFISLTGVEQIEICRGSQSTLYGSDAEAGVINIITTKKAVSGKLHSDIVLLGGSYGTVKAHAQVSGNTGKWSYNAGLGLYNSDGFSSAYDSTGKGNFDNDGFKSSSYNAYLKYQLNNTTSFKGFARYNKYKAETDAGAFTDGVTDYNLTNDNLTTGVGFTVKKDKLQENGLYQYNSTKRLFNYGTGSIDNYHSINQLAEYYATISLFNHLSLLAGGEYRYSSMNNVSSYGNMNDSAFNQYSVYASLMYKLDKLNVELGGRFNNHSRYGNNYTYTFNPSYSISNHYRVFGSISTGFKAPTLYQLYYNGGPFYPIGNANLSPEKSINYEVGVQQQFNKFSNRIVFFNRNISDGIDFNNITNLYFNFAKQNVNGIEYELVYYPSNTLRISANYTYNAVQQTTQNRINYKDTTYSYALKVPEHTFNITASFELTKHLLIKMNGKYSSSRYDLGGYDASFNALPDVMLSQFFLINAYAEYKLNKNIKLFADFENIGNVKFFETRGYNSIPRFFTGGVTVKL